MQVTIGPRLLTVDHARLLTFEALGLLALDVPNLFAVSAAFEVARLLVLHLAFGTVLTLDLARLLVPDLLMPDLSILGLLMLGLLMLGTTHLRAFGALHLWGTHFHAMSAAVALTATAARLLHRLATATAAAVTLAAAMALTAATVLGRRRSAAATILAIAATTTVAAAWPRACRGRDRERGNAGCEKYPGQHR